jgi:hypothetical protein
METSTISITINGTLILINLIIGFILGFEYGSWKYGTRKREDKKSKKSEPDVLTNYEELFINPIDALKEFEPIKSHVDECNKARKTCQVLNKAIRTNLSDNGYIMKGHKPLPELTELQNIIRLKPIIKDLEDQYKRLEEATATCEVESKWTAFALRSVMTKVMDDPEIKRLVSERGIEKSEHHNRDLYELLKSHEAEEVIEKCITEYAGSANND